MEELAEIGEVGQCNKFQTAECTCRPTGHTFLRWDPRPDYMKVLLFSFSNAIAGWGVHLLHSHADLGSWGLGALGFRLRGLVLNGHAATGSGATGRADLL